MPDAAAVALHEDSREPQPHLRVVGSLSGGPAEEAKRSRSPPSFELAAVVSHRDDRVALVPPGVDGDLPRAVRLQRGEGVGDQLKEDLFESSGICQDAAQRFDLQTGAGRIEVILELGHRPGQAVLQADGLDFQGLTGQP